MNKQTQIYLNTKQLADLINRTSGAINAKVVRKVLVPDAHLVSGTPLFKIEMAGAIESLFRKANSNQPKP